MGVGGGGGRDGGAAALQIFAKVEFLLIDNDSE